MWLFWIWLQPKTKLLASFRFFLLFLFFPQATKYDVAGGSTSVPGGTRAKVQRGGDDKRKIFESFFFYFQIHGSTTPFTLTQNQDYLYSVSWGKLHMVLKLRKSRIQCFKWFTKLVCLIIIQFFFKQKTSIFVSNL